MNSSLSNIVTPLLNWYHTYARTLPWRQSPSAYHIWVSEIMLQQTRVEAESCNTSDDAISRRDAPFV